MPGKERLSALEQGGDRLGPRRLAGEIEGSRVGAAAGAVDRLLRNADPRRRLAPDTAIGKRLDMFALLLGSKAVLPVMQRMGSKSVRSGGRDCRSGPFGKMAGEAGSSVAASGPRGCGVLLHRAG